MAFIEEREAYIRVAEDFSAWSRHGAADEA
jgi:hypothetical protein